MYEKRDGVTRADLYRAMMVQGGAIVGAVITALAVTVRVLLQAIQ